MKGIALGMLFGTGLACSVFACAEIYSNGKNTQAMALESPQWEAFDKINLDRWDACALTGNSGWDDLYLGVDQVWGGAIDARDFFHRYFAPGVQGTLLAVDDKKALETAPRFGFTGPA